MHFYNNNNLLLSLDVNRINNKYELFLFDSSNKIILEFNFPNDYPFKSYNINLLKKHINTRYFEDNKCLPIHETINYSKWLSDIKIINNNYHRLFMSNLLGNNFTISNNSCCFCCSSITCGE